MSEELDLGPVATAESAQLGGLLERRDETNEGRVPLGIAYLDDCLGGVYPGDLLLWGAGTGVGKTALAISTALSGVRAGLAPVYLFALEAEEGEVAARLYFQELGKKAGNRHLDFAGWWRGGYPHLDRRYGDEIKEELAPLLANLRVVYKGPREFTVKHLVQQLEGIAHNAKMVVLDHLHMVDEDTGENELRAQKKSVQLLRDMALGYRIPVCVASHIRKQQAGMTQELMPKVDDLHGSSSIAKVATQIVLFARDWDGPKPHKHLAPTLVKVAKDRRGRGSTDVARIYYDQSEGRYETAYELGKLYWEQRKQEWRPVPMTSVPAWAVNEARVRAASDELPL